MQAGAVAGLVAPTAFPWRASGRAASGHPWHGADRSGGGAARAKAFGLQVHYHNRKRLRPEVEAELEATYWESLDQMVSRMDIISINCPHTPSTFHLMNARRLKLMKPSAVIVNTSRGEVIDENALTRGLRAGEGVGRRRSGRLRTRHGGVTRAARLAECGAAAAHGLGHGRGPDRAGRKGHHQHQDLRRRPPPPGSGGAGNAVRLPHRPPQHHQPARHDQRDAG